MAGFDAADAGIEGLRLTRERPTAVLIWAGLMLVTTVVFSSLLIGLAGDAYNDLIAMQQSGERADPERALAAFRGMAPALLLMLPLALLYYAVLYSAAYRAILRPEEGGPGFLKVGADELRMLGATVLLALMLAGLTLGVSLVYGFLVAIAAGAGGAAAGLLAFLGFFAVIAALVFFAVRFSLVLPATFAQRRIAVSESWRLTKGRFWPLLGAYVLSIALAIVVWLLALMIYFAVAALVAGVSEAGAVFQPDYGSFASWFTPAMILYLLVSALVNAMTTAIILAPSAMAYRALSGERERQV